MRSHRAEFVDAEDGRLWRCVGVKRDDRGLCGDLGTKSGSLLIAHSCVLRQRTPSRKKIRRTWLRATWMPCCWAAAASMSSVHSGLASGSGTPSSPVSSGERCNDLTVSLLSATLGSQRHPAAVRQRRSDG